MLPSGNIVIVSSVSFLPRTADLKRLTGCWSHRRAQRRMNRISDKKMFPFNCCGWLRGTGRRNHHQAHNFGKNIEEHACERHGVERMYKPIN